MSKKTVEHFMNIAIDSSRKNPSAPFGAIIVYDDREVIFQSVNDAKNNPIMHGELSVLHKCFEAGFEGDHDKLSLYTTAEPCPMCAAAIYWSKIPKVIYGSSIPFLNALFGRQIAIRAKDVFEKTPSFYNCQLIPSVLEDDCNALFLQALEMQKIDRSTS